MDITLRNNKPQSSPPPKSSLFFLPLSSLMMLSKVGFFAVAFLCVLMAYMVRILRDLSKTLWNQDFGV